MNSSPAKPAIFVTGGAGYIGSHACRALAGAGFYPVTIDNLSTGHRWAVKWGPLVEADLRDRSALDAAFSAYRPIGVLHFAASALVGESVKEPSLYYQNNIGATLTLLEAMRAHGVGSLIFSSTCATYGAPLASPIRETHPQQPINPYGRSKWMVEQILADYASAYGLRYLALRYFNVAGAAGEIGELHEPETHLVPLALFAAMGKREQLEVFGTDYPTPDGSAIRDYLHVEDLVRAHLLGLDYLLQGGAVQALNLGTGRGISVLEIIRTVERVTGRSVPVRLGARREGDPPLLAADYALAERELGWRPLKTLDEIVTSAWDWHTADRAVCSR